MNSSKRRLYVNIALSALGFALLGVVVWRKQGEIAGVLQRRPDVGLFSLAFSIYMTGIVLTFARWFLLVRALGLPFRFRDALRLGFIGNLFNLVIPGAVSGDLVKAAFLCREQSRKTQAVASMVIDRILGLLGLFLLASVFGAFAWEGAGTEGRRLIGLAWLASASGLAGLAVLAIPALHEPLFRLFRGRGRLGAVLAELKNTVAAYRQRLGVVLIALFMAMGNHSLNVVAFYLVSVAMKFSDLPTLGQHFLVVPLSLFTTAAPLPFGALGVTEHVSEQLFRLVKPEYVDGALAMIGFRVLMYAGGLVSAVVYLANIRQVRSLGEGEDEAARATDRPLMELEPSEPR